MISRKDYLLIRPWQQKRYENHRRKVQSALPAIDNRPPPERVHVTLKLKKQQKENERCKKIENDNHLLLKKMNYIMRTTRVDHFWETPQPNFLNRIAMYDSVIPKIDYIDDDILDVIVDTKSRKSRCSACTPQKHEQVKIPEERIPWEPKQQSKSRKRSKSVPAKKTEHKQSDDKQKLPIRPHTTVKPTNNTKKTTNESKIKMRELLQTPQTHKITIKKGSLNMTVNIPSDTFVEFQEGANKKILMHNVCHCSRKATVI